MGSDWNDRDTPALEGLFGFGSRKAGFIAVGVSRVALTLAGIGRPAPNPGQSL